MDKIESNFQKLCVMGLGYIGLPTASLLASKGFDVQGVDVNPSVVETINAGHIHIREPELDILVKSAVQSGRLKADTQPTEADVFILAVPTPFKDGYVPDLAYVENAARAIAPYLKPGNLVILESTSPVGTTEKVEQWLTEERPEFTHKEKHGNNTQNGGIHIAHCPERVLPGHIIRELVENDRIVGGIDEKSTGIAADFYRQFVAGKILTTTNRTAEMAKLTENTFRDVNIALANELSLICDTLEINVWELIRLANHHPRVNILNPGPGVGGHCIAVDPWFIVHSDPNNAKVIRTSREVNNGKPHYVVDKVIKASNRFKEPPVIVCLGLAFKADIDDLRESPAVEIVETLIGKGVGKLLVVEPNVDTLPPALDGKIKKTNLNEALTQADIVLLLVDHKEFKQIQPEQLHRCVTIDTRGVWD